MSSAIFEAVIRGADLLADDAAICLNRVSRAEGFLGPHDDLNAV
jgi:hypothetical protein